METVSLNQTNISQNTNKVPSITGVTSDFFEADHLRSRVFLDKYALKNESGDVVEDSPTQMWNRVATAISSIEPDNQLRNQWYERFLWLLADFRFIPGGRILFGAGNPRNVTLLNCYVIPVKSDCLEDIFDWMKEAARTYSYGGGVGTDISILRPKGARVNNAALTSTGSVSFMDLFSLTTGTIGQSGRRGALMITMRDSHPDIMDFMQVKRNLRTVRYANISVKVSDALMKAVEKDEDFDLSFENEKVKVHRKIRAKEVWNELITGARDWAEPGVLFWDSIKRESTSEYNRMEVISTNPCAEIGLEGYGDCCLGNINLSKFVLDEFTHRAKIDWFNLELAVRYGVRFLDNVLDYNADKHPLKSQTEASLKSRRIGLGFTGLGDMLCQLQLKYDSDESIKFVDQLFSHIKNLAYDESVNLAVERGVFANYDKIKHLKSPYIHRLSKKVRERIEEHGLRNVAVLTVPPVGSGAALAGTTSGIEPIFDLSYTRRSESLSEEYFKVYHPLVSKYIKRFGLKNESELPDFFVTAHKIVPEKRVLMQAAIQKHIDHSISSTVNLSRDATNEDVSKIYFLAWKLGCKGITVYREGSREGILISNDETKRKENPLPTNIGSNPSKNTNESPSTNQFSLPRTRPKVTSGRTEKIETPRGPIYVTINEDDFGLCEMFVRSLDAEAEAFGRLTSLILRASVDPREVIEQLWSVNSRELAIDKSDDSTSVHVTTVAQGIALALGRYLYGSSFNPKKTYPHASKLPLLERQPVQLKLSFNYNGNGHDKTKELLGSQLINKPASDLQFTGVCPDCGSNLRNENGCSICTSCGFFRCG